MSASEFSSTRSGPLAGSLKASSAVEVDALAALNGTGCPACRRGTQCDHRNVSALVTDLYTHPVVVTQLRQALGLCPVHTRLVMARPEACCALRAIYAEVVDAALVNFARGPRRRHGSSCPLCADRVRSEQAAIGFILSAATATPIANRYRRLGGFCLQHCVTALGSAAKVATDLVVTVLRDRLQDNTDPRNTITLLAGEDSDRYPRRALRRRAEKEAEPREARRQSVRQKALARLKTGACPICSAAHEAERRFLSWFADEVCRRPFLLAADALRFCPSHLADLAEDQPEAADWAAARLGHELLNALTEGSPHPAAVWRTRWSVWLPVLRASRSRRNPRSRIAEILTAGGCSVCHAIRVAEGRTTQLLHTLLLDPPVVRCYERSHGVCALHAPAVSSDGAVRAILGVLRARLTLLEWELDEAGRKSAWLARYEPSGGREYCLAPGRGNARWQGVSGPSPPAGREIAGA